MRRMTREEKIESARENLFQLASGSARCDVRHCNETDLCAHTFLCAHFVFWNSSDPRAIKRKKFR